jgi:hypothetical protein
MLEVIRVKHKLPALAAAVVVDGKIVVTNAVGVRKSGGSMASPRLSSWSDCLR